MKLNRNYDNLQESYLFSTVARKAREFAERNPNADLIKLSIG
ncbi:MAG: LL-diaminopimelate aminotransferase, partial [Oscillospiraceae bacterium]